VIFLGDKFWIFKKAIFFSLISKVNSILFLVQKSDYEAVLICELKYPLILELSFKVVCKAVGVGPHFRCLYKIQKNI
jgi:hypothetical protein